MRQDLDDTSFGDSELEFVIFTWQTKEVACKQQLGRSRKYVPDNLLVVSNEELSSLIPLLSLLQVHRDTKIEFDSNGGQLGLRCLLGNESYEHTPMKPGQKKSEVRHKMEKAPTNRRKSLLVRSRGPIRAPIDF